MRLSNGRGHPPADQVLSGPQLVHLVGTASTPRATAALLSLNPRSSKVTHYAKSIAILSPSGVLGVGMALRCRMVC